MIYEKRNNDIVIAKLTYFVFPVDIQCIYTYYVNALQLKRKKYPNIPIFKQSYIYFLIAAKVP